MVALACMRSAVSRNLTLLAALVITSVPLSLVAAQTQSPGLVNCFDYYHFGSVQVDVTPTVASAVSGTPITFTGTLRNANSYPIVDGSVYVKIFRERGDGSKDSNGPDVVDQFYALEGISLPAGGSKPVDITWTIPAYASSGSYKVATFFTVSHKFNLLGLPFTDDVVGNTASFKVSGEQKATVAFKKDAVRVGGEQYRFAAFPPREPSTGPVVVEALLTNPASESVTVPVTWTLYSWSGNDPENAIGTRTEQVTIPAGGQKLVSYTVSDSQYPVYLLTGSAKWHDSSSIINVRFVREGKDQLRINFPAVTSYPLTAGEPTALFSCLHNAGESDVVPDSRLVLTLLDQNGEPHSHLHVHRRRHRRHDGRGRQLHSEQTYDTLRSCELYQGQNSGAQDMLTSILVLEILAALIGIAVLVYIGRAVRTWKK